MGGKKDFNEAEREHDKTQETIDICIKESFIKTYKDENNEDPRMIALTEKGLKFRDFSYFLTYLVKEVGLGWTAIITFLAGVGIPAL